MSFLGNYSQNFLAGSFVAGNYRLVGVTTGILYVVKPAGNKSLGSGRPIGAYKEKKWSLPEFDWNEESIRTRHIRVKWMLKPIEVDVVFLSEDIEESEIRAWATMKGYKEVQILLNEDVELIE